MKKEYGNALRVWFPRKLKEECPDFVPMKEKSPLLWNGERAFFRQASETTRLFLVLVPNIKAFNNFTLEIGWSTLNRFPEQNSRPYGSISTERREFKFKERILRMSQLWTNLDPWWDVAPIDFGEDWSKNYEPVTAEEAKVKVLPQIKESIQKFKRYGVPYLNEFLESQK